MKEYQVLRDCWGFKGRHYTKGSFVQFENDDTPPHHFKYIRAVEAPPQQPAMFKKDLPKDPMRPVAAGESMQPKGGMNAGFEPVKPAVPVTAGQALSKKPGRKLKTK